MYNIILNSNVSHLKKKKKRDVKIIYCSRDLCIKPQYITRVCYITSPLN